MPSIVRRIVSLKELGVFRNFAAPADLPDLQRHNLIYGFNGSGKTTLARVFGSLEVGALRPELPEGGTFEVELTDGTVIKSHGTLDSLKGRLLVFNVDFIEENLRWKDGTAKPVFLLGKEQVQLAKKLGEKEADLTALDHELTDAKDELGHREKGFTTHKRDAARLIAEELGLGRRYDATNLVADFAKGTHGESFKLSEDQRQHLRSVIAQEAPLPKQGLLDTAPLDLAGLVRDVRKILGTSLGTLVVDGARGHETMLKWVKDGMQYHREHDLSVCLLCGSHLTLERMQVLDQAIDGAFDQLTGEIAAAREKAADLHDRLAALRGAIPSDNDISKELQIRFASTSGDLQTSFTAGSESVRRILALLEQKAIAPNLRVDEGELVTELAAANWVTTTAGQLSDLVAVLEAHNASHDDFDQVQEAARTKLKEHFLAESQADYRTLESDVKDSKSLCDRLNDDRIQLRRDLEHLRQEMRQHGRAADMISRMIHSYLGHKELEIRTLEDGYQLRRNGQPVTGSLSEGEKTAIALCYFLSTVEAEGRKPQDLIVVMDDPISSLDTRALNYAFNMIKAALSGAGQLIIMTHNLHFMNEAKKWLKNKTAKEVGKDQATSTLLFLDAVQDGGTETRSSSIKIMPALIREYESEYHYLFRLVLNFSRSPHGETEYLYLMPNAMRKVLEIFLAFKLPGSEGLSNKVESIARGGDGIDPDRIRALDRLVQLESHADNLDDLVSFSSMTIEETKAAADALLGLMEVLDKWHFDRLRRICSRPGHA